MLKLAAGFYLQSQRCTEKPAPEAGLHRGAVSWGHLWGRAQIVPERPLQCHLGCGLQKTMSWWRKAGRLMVLGSGCPSRLSARLGHPAFSGAGARFASFLG